MRDNLAPVLERITEAIKKFGDKAHKAIQQIMFKVHDLFRKAMLFYISHKQQIDKILDGIKEAFNTTCDLIAVYFSTTFAVIGDIFATFINVAGDIISFVVDVFSGNWAQAWEHVKQIFADIWDGIKNIFSDFVNGISNALDRIIGKAGDAKSAAEDAQDESETGHNASGTDNWRGGLTWINEKGPELVDLPSGTRIHPHDESLQMEYQRGINDAAASGGLGGNITIAKLADSIVVHDQQDIDEITTQLLYKLQSYAINSKVRPVTT
jgi:phage-related protein